MKTYKKEELKSKQSIYAVSSSRAQKSPKCFEIIVTTTDIEHAVWFFKILIS